MSGTGNCLIMRQWKVFFTHLKLSMYILRGVARVKKQNKAFLNIYEMEFSFEIQQLFVFDVSTKRLQDYRLDVS